jgi:hypothetical protein
MLVVACSPAADQVSPAPLTVEEKTEIEAMLLGLENEWGEAYRTGDLSVFERIFAPDFIYTINGELHDKASFIALGANVAYTTFETGDMAIRWYADNVVVITGTDAWVGTDAEGNEVSGADYWTNVFVERDGEWQVVVGHASERGE